jgi:hypothetical protein
MMQYRPDQELPVFDHPVASKQETSTTKSDLSSPPVVLRHSSSAVTTLALIFPSLGRSPFCFRIAYQKVRYLDPAAKVMKLRDLDQKASQLQ